jgi:hypothetical protein
MVQITDWQLLILKTSGAELREPAPRWQAVLRLQTPGAGLGRGKERGRISMSPESLPPAKGRVQLNSSLMPHVFLTRS